jgi:hypothetical protein
MCNSKKQKTHNSIYQKNISNKNYMKAFFLIPLLLFFPIISIFGQSNPNLFLGFEVIELQQNSFKNLGKNNYTFFIGTSFPINEKTLWGGRITSMNVELSEKHLQEPSPVYKGDFKGVTGNLNVQRIYLDYYYRWNLNFLWIEPIFSVGIGYNNWKFYNKIVDESYDLKTASLGVSGKVRFTFFKYPFIEIPSLDVFGFIYKNRNPEEMLGDAHIDFWKRGGVFNWIFIGCNIPLNKLGKQP